MLLCLADALGRPLAFHQTVGEAADCKANDALIGLPERRPGALLADTGYDAYTISVEPGERRIEARHPKSIPQASQSIFIGATLLFAAKTSLYRPEGDGWHESRDYKRRQSASWLTTAIPVG